MKKNPEKYPWASLPTPAYYSVEVRPREKWKTVLMFFIALGLIYLGIQTKIWISVIFGVLYLLTIFMDRNVVATERGVELYNNMRIAHHYDRWDWSDLSSITFEIEDTQPDKIKLHFGKEAVSKTYYFKRSDWGKIMAYAKAGNPAIKIYDMEQLGLKTKPKAKPNPKSDKKKKRERKSQKNAKADKKN